MAERRPWVLWGLLASAPLLATLATLLAGELFGTADKHTTPEEARGLQSAAGPEAELWLVEGAAHVDLHDFGPEAYEARVGPFLAGLLRQHSAQPDS